ncbi:MaoC/PaaZ C-terminal domain-containing protein [Chloroflexota bacterium]
MIPKRTLYFEDLEVGNEAPVLVKDDICRTDIVRYAGASGDFSPIHHDEVIAKRSGNDRVYAMGMMSAGYLGRMITDWLGDGTLRKLSFRFVERVWSGDRLICSGVVKHKYKEEAENRVDCDVWVENQHGESVIRGKAIAALPSMASSK